MKEFEWFEWFEWFGPSPIEPFNSGVLGKDGYLDFSLQDYLAEPANGRFGAYSGGAAVPADALLGDIAGLTGDGLTGEQLSERWYRLFGVRPLFGNPDFFEFEKDDSSSIVVHLVMYSMQDLAEVDGGYPYLAELVALGKGEGSCSRACEECARKSEAARLRSETRKAATSQRRGEEGSAPVSGGNRAKNTSAAGPAARTSGGGGGRVAALRRQLAAAAGK